VNDDKPGMTPESAHPGDAPTREQAYAQAANLPQVPTEAPTWSRYRELNRDRRARIRIRACGRQASVPS
jgi:hypothetical protein